VDWGNQSEFGKRGCEWRFHPHLTFMDPMAQTNEYSIDPITGAATMHGPGQHTVDVKKPISHLLRFDAREHLWLQYKRHLVCYDPSSEDVPVIHRAATEIAREKERNAQWSQWRSGPFPKDVIGTFQAGWEGRTTYPVYHWTPNKERLLARPRSNTFATPS
jgi:hypothetical protein